MIWPVYEETDGPYPEGEYDDEDDDLINLDNGARVPHQVGAVGDDTVSVTCQPDDAYYGEDTLYWYLLSKNIW